MITNIRIGTRVKSNRDFCGVPAGTEGVIDEHYRDFADPYEVGIMVAWDLPNQPLPPGYNSFHFSNSYYTGILRDGFAKNERVFLDPVSDY